MEIYLIITLFSVALTAALAFYVGHKTNQHSPSKKTESNYLQEIQQLTIERNVLEVKAAHLEADLTTQKKQAEEALIRQEEAHRQHLNEREESAEKRIRECRQHYEEQIEHLKNAFTQQLQEIKANNETQVKALTQMNQEQIKSQMQLIKEQMQTTSEAVLKRRQDELSERNKEQVSKIIDPLQKSLHDMQQALLQTKEQQNMALARLDATIKVGMEQSNALGEKADRLTRALTGEVKVQGNFGELKLKQLLEDLELHEGEQFDTQETLKGRAGKALKGDDGKGLVPDFILHFPNNRHVVVDSKMSLTDYEKYMNANDHDPKKSEHLHAHIESVRMQVKRLAKKEYYKYLPEGYNRLNFAIMYIPIEGALNLALLNDSSLWREAYDAGVLILGPQTMYMNLRVLELMWTQVRQLNNQQAMIEAANSIIDRVQDFGSRFIEVEDAANDTIKKIAKLKITTADSGASIVTAAKKLLKAGAYENKKKRSLSQLDESIFLEVDTEEPTNEGSK